MSQKPAPLCTHCGNEIAYSGRGRRPKFCSQSCRQRAYEKRIGARQPIALDNADHAELGQKRLDRLNDGLYELRCAAEDVELAAQEGADRSEIIELCHEVVAKARAVEKMT
ncbi:hypothetical protein [Corynebacterium sp. H78]|uniref:hypothetical protein n=1 Tax=Corynebacterium sp. H78 TaxID=3133417 RepID=UPI003096415D